MMAYNNKYSAKKKFEIKVTGITLENLAKFGGLSSRRFSIYVGGKKSEWYLEFKNDGEDFLFFMTTLHKLSLEPGTADFAIKWNYKWFTKKKNGNGQSSHVYSSTALQNGTYNSELVLVSFYELMRDDYVILLIEIEWEQEKDQIQFAEPISVPIKYNTNFFQNKDLSDFTLMSSDGEKFPTHRFILATYSPVFGAMFNSQMAETQSSTARIEDIDGGALLEMLRFVYCGKVENLKTHAHALLRAADKYEIVDLKPLCASSIIKRISKANIFDSIVLADQCNSQNLLQACLEFIKNNYDLLHGNKDWKKINFELMLQIMDALEKGSKTMEIEIELAL